MDYPAPYFFPAAPPVKSNKKKIIVIIVVIVVIIVILAALGIGLGVGLGVGLSRRGHDSHSSSSNSGSGSNSGTVIGSSGGSSGGSSSGSSSGSSGGSSGGSSSGNTYSILSPPSVTCTYNSNSPTCGCPAIQPSFLTPRIFQGYTAVANSWPWIVAILVNNGDVFCGGFLISPQHVLTAAHCVIGATASSITVYAGVQKTSLLSSAQSRVVSSSTTHPDYSSSTVVNDIAVLTLTSAFNQSTTVGVCCLTFDTSLPSAGEHGVIAGWGEATAANTAVSDDLLQGVIEVQPFSLCSSTSTENIRFCAGYNGTDACYGDSGSPFMTNVNNLWTCTGIVSAGIGCGQNTLYTRVSAYQSFINGIVNGK